MNVATDEHGASRAGAVMRMSDYTGPAPAQFDPSAFDQSNNWVAVVRRWSPPTDLATRAVDVRFAIEGLILAGKAGALVAAGGTGKTTLLMYLGICHATGRPAFGRRVKTGTFVLLSSDDPQEDLEGALALQVRAMKLSPDEIDLVAKRVRVHSLQGLEGCKVFTTSAAGAPMATGLDVMLGYALAEIDDLVGVALDTLRQFSGGSSNDEQVIKLAVAAATDFARETGAYVVLPHHTGKQSYRDGVKDMYCGSGSAAIADNCRFVLLLQTATWQEIEDKVQRTGQERGDPFVLLSTRGSLLMKPSEPIFLHRAGHFIGHVAGAVRTKDQVADERDRKILRAVRRGAQTKNAIALAVGGRKKDVLDSVDALEARGMLGNGSQNGSRNKGEFVVTALGSRFIDDYDE